MTCSVDGCAERVACKGMCRLHYDRERGRNRHRHRDDALLRVRARNRAVARLIDAHPDEFADLFAEEKARAEVEADELEAAADRDKSPSPVMPRPDVRTSGATASPTSPRKPIRLLTGPRPAGQRAVDRIRDDVARCARCQTFHDQGHRCAECGSAPKAGTA